MAADTPDPGIAPGDDGLTARLHDAEAQLSLARAQLLAAEQANAEIGELREALRTATGELAAQEERLDALRRDLELSRAETDHLERLRADLQGSLSWKVTRPLRAAKRATGGPSDPA